jgi:hypothetical protein
MPQPAPDPDSCPARCVDTLTAAALALLALRATEPGHWHAWGQDAYVALTTGRARLIGEEEDTIAAEDNDRLWAALRPHLAA